LVDKNRPYAQVLEENVDGSVAVRYVHGLDLISQSNNGQQSVYLVDGLGSTRVLADESGGVIDSYTYDAFGSLINSTGGTENKYLFAGEQFDENLGQYYLRARYYDPSAGRFTRRDTYEGDVFEPATLHKYLYAHANPVNGIDPSGLYPISLSYLLFYPPLTFLTVPQVALAGAGAFGIGLTIGAFGLAVLEVWDTWNSRLVELDPPFRERHNWPRKCQLSEQFQMPTGEDLCVYICRDWGGANLHTIIEHGNECPKWLDWIPQPKIDPDNYPPDANPLFE
jgi:RHS repeat-associated protein